MNTRFLCAFFSILVSLNTSFAMKNTTELPTQNPTGLPGIPTNIVAPGDKPIACGTRGKIYIDNSNQDHVIKYLGKPLWKASEDHELIAASKLSSDDVPENLMRCYEIYDDVGYSCERIRGITLHSFLQRIGTPLTFEFFCQKWVIGMFNAMNYFRNHIKTLSRYNGMTFTVDNLPSDMTSINIMVWTEGPRRHIPVRVDYGLLDDSLNTDVLELLGRMLVKTLDTKVRCNSKNLEKSKLLRRYLTEELPKKQADQLEEIVSELNAIIYDGGTL